MKTKFCRVALLALMLCGTGMLSYAQGGGAWGGHAGYFGHMATVLNLTPAQKQQIKTIMEAQSATTRPLMQQLTQNRASMLSTTASGAFNQTTVQSLATQQAQIMAQLTVQRASLESQIYNQVLNGGAEGHGRPAAAEPDRSNQSTLADAIAVGRDNDSPVIKTNHNARRLLQRATSFDPGGPLQRTAFICSKSPVEIRLSVHKRAMWALRNSSMAG